MRFARAILALAAVTAAAATATAPVALTEATFDHETSRDVWFIKFYAPWCGHCKKLAPVIAQLAAAPALLDTNVHVATVDCTTERSVCERFHIGSYPTLKVVAQTTAYDYTGRRDVPAMVTFATTGYATTVGEHVSSSAEFRAQRQAAAAEQQENERQSAVVALTTASFEAQVLGSAEPWLIKFYAPWCGHCKRLAPTWHKLSRTLSELKSTTHVATVDCTVHRRVCSRFNVRGYPSLLYVRDGLVYRYQGGRTVPAFVQFVEHKGWQQVAASGPVPDEGLASWLVDSVMEWATQHTVLAVLACILVIAIVVAILVAVLDYWLGADDVAQYKKVLEQKQVEVEKDMTKEKSSKEQEHEALPPRAPSAAEAKKSGQKPKDE